MDENGKIVQRYPAEEKVATVRMVKTRRVEPVTERGTDHPGPWKTVAELELATHASVHWHNQDCLRRFTGAIPSAEFEALLCRKLSGRRSDRKRSWGISIESRTI